MNMQHIHTPLGRLTLVGSERALIGLYFEDHRPVPRRLPAQEATSPMTLATTDAVRAYLEDGSSRCTLPLEMTGTVFERAVWDSLRDIPAGETRSYGELARMLGRPAAARAVGAAVARNPISIFVPCHRVVGARGALTGFAGGLPRKAWLLEHERAHC